MNRYRTRLFEANSPESGDPGAFTGDEDWKMDAWTTAWAELGYTLHSVQPIVYYGSLHVVVTMERIHLDTRDDA